MSALFHLYLCGRKAAEWLINMENTNEILKHIADSIRQTGNDPHDQLYGYVTTGDVTFITRHNNARALIQTVDKKDVKQFVRELKKAI